MKLTEKQILNIINKNLIRSCTKYQKDQVYEFALRNNYVLTKQN